jgi:hypothetical protein
MYNRRGSSDASPRGPPGHVESAAALWVGRVRGARLSRRCIPGESPVHIQGTRVSEKESGLFPRTRRASRLLALTFRRGLAHRGFAGDSYLRSGWRRPIVEPPIWLLARRSQEVFRAMVHYGARRDPAGCGVAVCHRDRLAFCVLPHFHWGIRDGPSAGREVSCLANADRVAQEARGAGRGVFPHNQDGQGRLDYGPARPSMGPRPVCQ